MFLKQRIRPSLSRNNMFWIILFPFILIVILLSHFNYFNHTFQDQATW